MTDVLKYEDPRLQDFNESLDVDGSVVIADIPFQRSRILYELAYESYQDAYNDYLDDEFQRLQQVVYDSYPACIAFNFRLSEKGEGANDPIRKLMHLKDSWESIVFVLYALVMGEVRFKNVDLKGAQVFAHHDTAGNLVFSSFNTDKIFSDAIKQKIQNIKGIVEYCKSNGLGFKCEAIDDAFLDDLLQLQDIRNEISHHTAPTREQAEVELKQVVPLFRQMLVKTRFLENCKILRFENYATKCFCEGFNSHALNREFDNYDLSDAQRNYILGLGQEQLFVLWGEECFGLSPFLHFERDGKGHESYICFYKGKKAGKYWYEPVKVRTEKTFDVLQTRFNAEKDEILRLMVP